MSENISRISLLIPDWPAPENVLAGITLRGPFKQDDEYSSFNLALHVDDDEEHVLQHRKTLKESLVLPAEPHWLEQVHGTECIDLSKVSDEILRADAAFTQSKKQVCAVMTADCLPLLVTDKQGRAVAAIHAGWRGLVNGVIKNTIEMFCQDLDIATSECMVWLGPAISQKHFEVGQDVYETFIRRHSSEGGNPNDVKEAFVEHASEHGKYFCDLYQLARLELQSLGVNDIYGGDQCTYTQEDRYYSYRRTSHQGRENCGRMASLIWMV